MERIIESWITRVENFYSLQSIPVKVLIFIVGVVGIYALGTLILENRWLKARCALERVLPGPYFQIVVVADQTSTFK